MLVRNPWQGEFADRVAFLTASRRPHGITADRTEFIGREGTLRRPSGAGALGSHGERAAGTGSLCGIPGPSGSSGRCRGRGGVRAGRGSGSRARPRAGGQMAGAQRGGRRVGAARTILGRSTGHDPCRDSRWRDERHAEPMAPLSGHRLEDVRQNGLLSVEWRHRFSRSAAGRAGARHGRARAVPRASSGLRRPTIRRRRCAALVAPTCCARGADAMLGRSPVAALRGRALRVGDRGRDGA